MRRFFLDRNCLTGNSALITGTEAHHLIAVLRLQPGTLIELFDGHGGVYRAELTEITAGVAKVRILSASEQSDWLTAPLTLAMGLLKGKKMDFLVQKATELGVYRFHPLLTKYSEKRDVRERQQERWQRIMLEACKQCNRSQPMEILPLQELPEYDPTAVSLKWMFWEQEHRQSVPNTLPGGTQPLCLLIGPEGGFHPREVELMQERGFLTLSLGQRTLRAETAALGAIVLGQFLLGGLTPQPTTSPS